MNIKEKERIQKKIIEILSKGEKELNIEYEKLKQKQREIKYVTGDLKNKKIEEKENIEFYMEDIINEVELSVAILFEPEMFREEFTLRENEMFAITMIETKNTSEIIEWFEKERFKKPDLEINRKRFYVIEILKKEFEINYYRTYSGEINFYMDREFFDIEEEEKVVEFIEEEIIEKKEKDFFDNYDEEKVVDLIIETRRKNEELLSRIEDLEKMVEENSLGGEERINDVIIDKLLKSAFILFSVILVSSIIQTF